MGVPLSEDWFSEEAISEGGAFSGMLSVAVSAGAVFSTDALLAGGVFSELFIAAAVSAGAIFSADAVFVTDIFSVVASTKQPTAGVSLYLTHK
jgi:hypothetical protein